MLVGHISPFTDAARQWLLLPAAFVTNFSIEHHFRWGGTVDQQIFKTRMTKPVRKLLRCFCESPLRAPYIRIVLASRGREALSLQAVL